MSLEKRLAALEAAAGAGEKSIERPWRQLIVHEGQSVEDAARAEGIDTEAVNLIVRRIVTPRFDEEGNIVPPPSPPSPALRPGNWRDLCDL